MSENLQRRAEKIVGDLKKLSDLVVTANHRATAETQEAVKIVATELTRAAEKIRASAAALAAWRDEARVQEHLGVLEARDRLALVGDVARTALAGAAKSASFIGDTARLELALARMDAGDLFEQKRRDLVEERRRLEAATEAALRDIDQRVTELNAALAEKR